MTRIEWTHRPGTKGETWNPVAGCTKISTGCDNCYALRDSWRIVNHPKHPARYDGVAQKVWLSKDEDGPRDEWLQWTGRVNVDPAELERPLRWRAPRTVFVCSMADLFHAKVPDQFIQQVWMTMARRPEHTFLVLTKRAQRMARWIGEHASGGRPYSFVNKGVLVSYDDFRDNNGREGRIPWPLPNVWLGVTAENQETADERIPLLLDTPAAVRFVSVEPMLGPIDLSFLLCDRCGGEGQYSVPTAPNRHPSVAKRECLRCKGRGTEIDWIIVGGESGPGARPMQLEWARGVRDQCVEAGVPFFFKQWGEWAPVWDSYAMMRLGKSDAGHRLDGKEWHQWPR